MVNAKDKFSKKTERNQFNYQWGSIEEKKDFLTEMEKIGAKSLSEYIRAIHREHKEKNKI